MADTLQASPAPLPDAPPLPANQPPLPDEDVPPLPEEPTPPLPLPASVCPEADLQLATGMFEGAGLLGGGGGSGGAQPELPRAPDTRMRGMSLSYGLEGIAGAGEALPPPPLVGLPGGL